MGGGPAWGFVLFSRLQPFPDFPRFRPSSLNPLCARNSAAISAELAPPESHGLHALFREALGVRCAEPADVLVARPP
eukprot:7654542-Prorocentrum_lima.AAC.1